MPLVLAHVIRLPWQGGDGFIRGLVFRKEEEITFPSLAMTAGNGTDEVKPRPFISTNFWICPERGSEKGEKWDGRRISHGPLSQQFILTRRVR